MAKNRIGERYGFLTVVASGAEPNTWVLRCECGNTITASGKDITRRYSCGCKGKYKRRATPPPTDEWKKLGQHLRCPYPSDTCVINKAGRCCWDCDKWAECPDKCNNSPAKCGRLKND